MDVYNVFPSATTTSSGIKDSPNICVVFDILEFNPGDDFGFFNNSTLESFLRAVSVPIGTIPTYDVRNDDVSAVQSTDHIMHPRT